MKTRSIFSALFLSLIFVSCNKTETTSKLIKDNFSVVIEGVFAKNDKLQVFYLTKGAKWNESSSVFRSIYGSNEMQKIEIDLPKNITPENLRVDFGFNPSQTHVTVKNISVKYKAKEINGDFDGFNRYFNPNEYMKWDPNFFEHQLININNVHDPGMTGNDLLISKLKKMKE